MSNGSLTSTLPVALPVARLCQVIQWPDFEGYGFNLQPGHYIGKVDEGSPAEAAGLKQGDRIIEVNGVNISNENHKQVVQRIKAVPHETKLLVVDPEADKYFKNNHVVVKSSLPHVVHLKTPLRGVSEKEVEVTKEHHNTDDTHSNKSEKSSESLDVEGNSPTEKGSLKSNMTTPSSDRKGGYSPDPQVDSADEAIPTILRDMPSHSPASNGSGSNDALHRNDLNTNLNLSMTAKELRAKLASRKKYDPKKESMDFKKKFDIVQKL